MDLQLIFYVALTVTCLTFVIVRKLRAKKKICPQCSEPLPTSRIPSNLNQVFWGGWTCKKCGTEVKVDFFGNIIN